MWIIVENRNMNGDIHVDCIGPFDSCDAALERAEQRSDNNKAIESFMVLEVEKEAR